AAVARGLLAGVAGSHWKATVESLHPRLTPTEWRRGAVSLVAAIATAPERALARAKDMIASGLVSHDRGILSTMLWGLPRALDAEPEAAEELLSAIVAIDGPAAAEGIVAIAREASGEAGKRVIELARENVLDRSLARELEETSDRKTLRERVAYALDLFIERGARKANTAALAALEAGRAAMTTLETEATGEAAISALRDLDVGLLEESTLGDLLVLATKEENPRAPVDDLHQRLGRWLLEQESTPPERTAAAISSSGRRLRALLHLLDSLGAHAEDELQNDLVRARRTDAARLLFSRLAADGRSALHRTLCATLARALDGLVRDASCEPVDVLLVTSGRLDEPSDVTTLAEASMDPDVEAALRAYARFMRSAHGEEPDPHSGRISRPAGDAPDSSEGEDKETSPIAAKIEAILELGAALADDGSGRAEGLRAVFVRLARALQTIASIEARVAVEAAASAFDALASTAHAYAQLEVGAQLRVLGESQDEAPASGAAVAQASRLSALLLRAGDKDPAEARSAVKEALDDLRRLLPPAFTRIAAEVLGRLIELPYAAGERTTATLVRVDQQLPAWLGPRRTIGGFYIVRPLGGGAASSVFVAKRLEERHDENAELFALKVPDYDGAAARSLSEKEFLEYFRAEATALLGLPPDTNLARFVTFDLAARPKPILVMELIEGPTLERFVAGAAADTNPHGTAARAFDVLDGVLAGLEVMHRHAIGHLDLKPSNVVLRNGQIPTLVDFGLAGRVIRPGCATGPYGAPEVWGVIPEDFQGEPSPMAANVYAFGALAFETLTGQTLFDGSTEVAIVSKHLVHDGHPPELDRLSYV
ncbi:MAG: protein kinase domain-containing protein, partial [Polyangiales bacterium]